MKVIYNRSTTASQCKKWCFSSDICRQALRRSPFSVRRSTSTVGFPRESKISLATTLTIDILRDREERGRVVIGSFSELKIKTDWRLKRWFCFKCENPSWSRRTGSCRSHAAVTLLLLEAGRIKLCIFLRLLSSSRNCSQSRFCAMVLFYTSGSSQFGRQWWGVGILRSGCISACQCTPCFQVF